MSLVFSDTSATGKDGILQVIERTLFGDNGDAKITGNANLLAFFTADVNLALDKAFSIIFRADGRWQFDDSNHTDYPTITTDLVSGQRDYTFTTDSNSNLILDIKRAYILPESGSVYNKLIPVDEIDKADFYDAVDAKGTPSHYGKKANGIFLGLIPGYAKTNGLKLEVNREASYFATTDTTKKPGIAGLFHEYLVLRPAYQYAYRNGLTNVNFLREEMVRMEEAIVEHYSKRDPDQRSIIKPKRINYI